MGSTTIAENIAVPAWLNSEFLEDILSEETNMDISVVDIYVKSAVPKGDNYLSTLYRTSVKYKENKNGSSLKNVFFIIKTLPVGELIQKFLSDLKGVEKEMHMYQTTLPSLYHIMKEKSPDQKLRPLSARCFPSARTDTIVLEDLQHLGYKMANRHKGLDLQHCRVAVRALARLHAASMVLYNTDPTSMDMYGEGMYISNEERREQMQLHFEFNMKTLSSKIEKWPGYEHYAEKITKVMPTALDRMIEAITPKKGSINVLNHGDCWVNNMLFRYCPETGNVQDVRFVDFQITRFSSPALDLQCFLCTSPNDDVRFQQRGHLLEEYHEELSDTMRQLDLDSEEFTLQQLKEEFEEKEIFGFLTACTVLCAVLADKDDAPDLSDITEEQIKSREINPMDKAYSGSRFRRVFQKMLLHYEKKGLI